MYSPGVAPTSSNTNVGGSRRLMYVSLLDSCKFEIVDSPTAAEGVSVVVFFRKTKDKTIILL